MGDKVPRFQRSKVQGFRVPDKVGEKLRQETNGRQATAGVLATSGRQVGYRWETRFQGFWKPAAS